MHSFRTVESQIKCIVFVLCAWNVSSRGAVVRALHVLRALVDPVLYFRGSARKYGNMKYPRPCFLAPEAGQTVSFVTLQSPS